MFIMKKHLETQYVFVLIESCVNVSFTRTIADCTIADCTIADCTIADCTIADCTIADCTSGAK